MRKSIPSSIKQGRNHNFKSLTIKPAKFCKSREKQKRRIRAEIHILLNLEVDMDFPKNSIIVPKDCPANLD